jgi:ribosomal protein S13
LEGLKIDIHRKVSDIDDKEQKLIVDELKKYPLENDLRREV